MKVFTFIIYLCIQVLEVVFVIVIRAFTMSTYFNIVKMITRISVIKNTRWDRFDTFISI